MDRPEVRDGSDGPMYSEVVVRADATKWRALDAAELAGLAVDECVEFLYEVDHYGIQPTIRRWFTVRD